MTFNYYEKETLNLLYRAGRPLTTSQISDKTGFSWVTTKKYLKKLYNKSYLRRKRQGKSIYWWLRAE